MTEHKRIRQSGIIIGELSPGVFNAITDIKDIRVGHTTLIAGEGPLQPGIGPVRTGVTVILPHSGNLFQEKVRGAVLAINGFGKACGFEQVRELGLIEAPIALTNTLNVGLVLDALVQDAIRQNPEIGIHTSTVNVVVGETNDGYLNDIQGRHVHAEHVWEALKTAQNGRVELGAAGAGTGTTCYGWKGGIGTASRVLPESLGGFTLGVLVQTNFGRRPDLLVCGIPVGKKLEYPPSPQGEVDNSGQGSVMIVLASDAPLSVLQLKRLCVRASAGLALTGSFYSHGSGDFVIAFSTARRFFHYSSALVTQEIELGHEEPIMNMLFRAVVECVEEAVLDSMACADTMIGRDGHISYGLPVDKVLEILHKETR